MGKLFPKSLKWRQASPNILCSFSHSFSVPSQNLLYGKKDIDHWCRACRSEPVTGEWSHAVSICKHWRCKKSFFVKRSLKCCTVRDYRLWKEMRGQRLLRCKSLFMWAERWELDGAGFHDWASVCKPLVPKSNANCRMERCKVFVTVPRSDQSHLSVRQSDGRVWVWWMPGELCLQSWRLLEEGESYGALYQGLFWATHLQWTAVVMRHHTITFWTILLFQICGIGLGKALFCSNMTVPLHENFNDELDWPKPNPDLNPIKHLWKTAQQRWRASQNITTWPYKCSTKWMGINSHRKAQKNLVERVEAGIAGPEVWFCCFDQCKFNQLFQAHKTRMTDRCRL